jgi:hypothetical protein
MKTYIPFPPNMTAKQAGIDTTRDFIVVEENHVLSVRTIVRLWQDDETDCPYFKIKGREEVLTYGLIWSRLAYADDPQYKEPEKEEEVINLVDYTRRLGDLIGREVKIEPNKEFNKEWKGHKIRRVEVVLDGFENAPSIKLLELLPKSKPKKLSKEEAVSLIKEKTGDDVEIV